MLHSDWPRADAKQETTASLSSHIYILDMKKI